jgi:hypothetical protein
MPTATTATQANGATKPVPEVTISINGAQAAEANVPMTWCINKAMLDELASRGAANPQLLISICNINGRHPTEMTRYIEPITLGTKYISFLRPGKNLVSVAIIWDDAGDVRGLKRRYLDRSATGYDLELYSYDSTDFREGLLGKGNIITSPNTITVDVPAGMFAKEPPKWLQTYVAKFVRGKALDQCHFRRRSMFAVPSMLLVLPLQIILRALAIGACGLIGFRGINPKPLWHPISSTLTEVWDNAHDPLWFMRKAGKNWQGEQKYREQYPPFWVINPLVIGIASVVLFIVSSWHVTRNERVVPLLGWSFLQCLGVAALGAVALVIGIAALLGSLVGLGIGGAWLLDHLIPKRFQRTDDTYKSLRQVRNERRQRKHDEAVKQARLQVPKQIQALQGMVCGGPIPKPTNPKHTLRENVQLRFEATKHKVCKPFAR